nr:type III-B CRISPR module RAMP protein Cmr6 [Candidatus Cloacimonadota bacterium]
MKANHYLPIDTFTEKPSQIDNFALRLNKFPPSYEKYEKGEVKTEFALNYHDRKKIHCELKLDIQNSRKQMLEFSAKYLLSLQQLPELKVETSAFRPDWRMVIGLGSASVYETSITLHHVYGFPYIPGQAVKGVTRNYVICEYFEKDEKEAEKNEEFKAIFGSQKQIGKITFFDAYPQTEPKLEFDIMNVHYSEYYSGKKEPTDDQNPNPITFLTVKDTIFFFPIGFPQDQQPDYFTIRGKSISDLLKTALGKKGIGAKTSVGYGYLNFDENVTQK